MSPQVRLLHQTFVFVFYLQQQSIVFLPFETLFFFSKKHLKLTRLSLGLKLFNDKAGCKEAVIHLSVKQTPPIDS